MILKKVSIFTIVFVAIFTMFVSTGANTVETNAVDVIMTTATLSDATISAIINNLKTTTPNWFVDYKYLIMNNASNTLYYIWLVPKQIASQIYTQAVLFGDNEYDTTYYNDIDKWYVKANATTINPVKYYYYYKSNNTLYASGILTQTMNNDITTQTLYYTNLTIGTYVSEYISNNQSNTAITIVNPLLFGYNPLPLNWLTTNSYVQEATDQTQTDELINANWGMFNFMKDFLNFCYESVMSVLTGLADGIASAFGALFVPSESTNQRLTDAQNDFMGALPFVSDIDEFINNLSETGTTMPMITGTIFNTEVSFDMKRDIFDPFLPIANSFKMIFRFAIWFGFIRVLWRQSERLINGSGG